MCVCVCVCMCAGVCVCAGVIVLEMKGTLTEEFMKTVSD